MVDNVSIILNETINQTSSNIPQITYLQNTLLPRITELITAPIENHNMLWTLAPMMIALILMQLYFGRNKDEALGWNTAYGNSVALIFISASLFRELYLISNSISFETFMNIYLYSPKMLLIIGLFGYGLILSTISYYHWLPEKIAFFIMNGISVNVVAYVVIVLVNSSILLDSNTVFAGTLIFIGVFITTRIIRAFIPASASARIRLAERKKSLIQLNINFLNNKLRNASELRKRMIEGSIERKKETISKYDEFIEKMKKQI